MISQRPGNGRGDREEASVREWQSRDGVCRAGPESQGQVWKDGFHIERVAQ